MRQRRYEALRAYFVDRAAAAEVAQRLGRGGRIAAIAGTTIGLILIGRGIINW